MMSSDPPIDHFEEAKRQARVSGAGMPLLRRIAALQAEMEARGVAREDPRIPAYFAALSPPDLARHLAISGQDQARQLSRGESIISPVGKDVSNGSARDTERESSKPLEGDLSDNWKELLRAGVPYLALLALVILLLYVAWETSDINPAVKESMLGNSSQQVEPQDQPPTDELELHYNGDFFVVLSWIAFCGLMLWRWIRSLRAQRLGCEDIPDLGPIIELSLKLGRDQMFSGVKAERAWRRLRLRRQTTSSRVNIRATMKATLARCGYPAIRFDTRRVRPEYLILSEREMPNDHLPEVGRALHAQMTAHKIDAVHYEFQDAPYRLRLDTTVGKVRTDRGFESLASALTRHEQARTLILMESFDAVIDQADSVTTRYLVPSWLNGLSDQQQPYLLNPRDRQYWDAREELLGNHALPSIPATSDGLQTYARRITTDGVAATPPCVARSEDDLPAFFASEREWLVNPLPLDPLQHDAVIDNLSIWLSTREMLWLRTLALFPTISRGFTHFSAMALFGGDAFKQLDFVKIARLPWFRVGAMPSWLREPLSKGMTTGELKKAKATVQAFFSENAGRSADASDILQLRLAQHNRREVELFRQQIQSNGVPALSDYLLRSAFESDDPMALTVEPITASPIPWYKREEMLAVAAALLASLALPLLISPTELVRPNIMADISEADSIADAATMPGEEAGNVTVPLKPPNADPPPLDRRTSGVTKGGSGISDGGRARAGGGDPFGNQQEPTALPPCCSPRTTTDRAQTVTLYTTGSVDVRSAPDVKFPIERTLPPGTTVYGTINSALGGTKWLRLTSGDEYVILDLLSQTPPTDAIASAPPEPIVRELATKNARSDPRLSRRQQIDRESDAQYDSGNFAKAFSLNAQSCDLDSIRGCYWNGYFFESGKGVERDLNQAGNWYRRACRLGSRQACDAAKRVGMEVLKGAPS